MTKEQLEKRRKVAKKVGLAIPIAGIALPLIFAKKGEKVFMAVLGGILGLIISAGVVVVMLPGIEEQEKIKK